MQTDIECIRTFITTRTTITSPPLCPEIRLHTTTDLADLQEAQHDQPGITGLLCPYWSMAWAGGQALARYILDNPHTVRGKRVLDFGSGSGLCGIAAALAGAARVEASDIDPVARVAMEMNAALNAGMSKIAIEVTGEDLIGVQPQQDVLIAADLWYERFLAQHLNSWLRQVSGGDCKVLLGDIGRAYFPKTGIDVLATYAVPTSESIEREPSTTARVWQLQA